jgi:hypothetical protein
MYDHDGPNSSSHHGRRPYRHGRSNVGDSPSCSGGKNIFGMTRWDPAAWDKAAVNTELVKLAKR